MLAFRSLSPAGKLRRLRTVAVEALRSFALPEYRLTLLADSFNTVYRVSARGENFLLRVGPECRIHPATGAVAEYRWLSDLASRGLLVPRIILTREGTPSVIVAAEHVPGARECTLLSWRSGQPIDRPVSSTDIADLATLSATLHEASTPMTTKPDGPLNGRSVLHFDIPDLLQQIEEPDRAIVQAAQVRAHEGLQRLWQRASETPRLIHSDLTPNNVLRSRGRLAAIDFQDMTWGHTQQDLANTLFGVTRGVGLEKTLPTFRASYERIRPWPDLRTDQIDDLFAARRLEMINLALFLDREGRRDYVARHASALRGYLS